MSSKFTSIPAPHKKGYTIYTKNGCYYCNLAKQQLYYTKHTIYICDDLYLDNKLAFFEKMEQYTKIVHKTFPIIFLDGEFIGGFSELKNKLSLEEKIETINTKK